MSVSPPLLTFMFLCSMLVVIGSHTHDVTASDVKHNVLPTPTSTVATAAGDTDEIWGDSEDVASRDEEGDQLEDLSSAKSVINNKRHKKAKHSESSDDSSEDSNNLGDNDDEDSPLPPRISDLSKSERKRVLNSLEASFLNIVGLKSRPVPDKSVTIPQYMMDLYQQHVQGNTGKRGRTKLHRGLHNSNTIRSFFQEEDNSLPDGVVRLKFNITSLPSTEELRAAELRLFREATKLENQLHLSNSSAAKLEELLHSKHRIDIYQIMLPSKRSIGRDAVTRLLDTKVVDPSSSGWETFDVTPALHHWRRDSKNYGFEVRFSKVSGEVSPLRHVRLKRSLQDTNVDVQESDRNWDKEGPLLITYSNDHSRGKRDTRKHRDVRKKRNPKNKDKRKKRKDRPKKHRDYKKNCKRRELYVDFEDVGWNTWIVAPPGYEAYYCYGECPFPLPEHLNTTNHAVVQQFVNSVDPQAAPKACCVPTELSEVSLLYIDEENKVVLRRYEEMVVEACGCR